MNLENDNPAIHLYAQICYKSGDYEKAFRLIEKSGTKTVEEKTNLFAAKIKSAEKADFNDIEALRNFSEAYSDEGHDLRLNKALLTLCLLGSAEDAENVLIKAKSFFKLVFYYL